MKDIAEARARLRGIFNIAVTPFHPDGALDHAGLARNIERVLGLGFDGILIGGTYGEFPAMSPQERAELFRRVMDVVGDRAPVMLCSAGSDHREVRDLTRLAGDLGGLPMVTPPFVSEVTDEQIVAFFRNRFPGKDDHEESFIGKTARAVAMSLFGLLRAVKAVDNDAVPSGNTSSDGLRAWAFVFGVPSASGSLCVVSRR